MPSAQKFPVTITDKSKVVVVGLGYVGLPLAIALAEHFETTGFDIDERRIDELRAHHDRTNEIAPKRLKDSSLALTSDPGQACGADIYIVTVPTPVDEAKQPDLRPVMSASRSVAGMIDPARPAIVVYESTVYPGVTEDICGPIIENDGHLRRGINFWLGYSPERINPGDREHTVDRIVKVIAGENEEVTNALDRIYSKVTSAGTFRAASIRTAEAAKVIENAQRDINIAFMNEVAQIFRRMDLCTWDVLEASRTKWNFLRFEPGLVGGHCIGVDPYYLSHLAQRLGHEPRVILAGRDINDAMGDWLAAELHNAQGAEPGRALVLGVTFKENVPDLRNSKVVDLIRGLETRGHEVTVHDPLADPDEARQEYGLQLSGDGLDQSYDLVVCAVPHQTYRDLGDDEIARLTMPGGLLADIKGCWHGRRLNGQFRRWTL